jgi:Ca2+-transporting ATPase
MTNTPTDQRINTSSPRKAWSLTIDEIVSRLSVDPAQGLTESEAAERLRQYGRNRLGEAKQRSVWAILWGQIKSILMLLLTAAAALAFAFGQPVEGVAILAVVILNIAIGFLMEWRAVRSMEALREMGTMETAALRDGHPRRIGAENIVPGDIVHLTSGDIITADLRIIEANKLQANESALTGESLPVTKQIDPAPEDAPLAERSNMLFKGAAITRGSGKAVVVSTGMNTELGTISSLTQEVKTQPARLERDINRLGYRLMWLTLIIAVFIIALGLLAGKEVLLIIETAIALAVATVPEGLPIVATIALAHGMWQMARSNALIRKLAAVQTLGSTGIIMTDKTGTLTENQMSVVHCSLTDGDYSLDERGQKFIRDDQEHDPTPDSGLLRRCLSIGVLCNNASLSTDEGDDEKAVGEPMEIALLKAARIAGVDIDKLRDSAPELREEAFDPEKKMMATFNSRDEQNLLVHVKGAPEAVLNACTKIYTGDAAGDMDNKTRTLWEERDDALAHDGLRVLAVAEKRVDNKHENPYENLTFVGLLGLLDPPREDVKEAIGECAKAGVRVIMATGDHHATAAKVAEAVGLARDGKTGVALGTRLSDSDGLSNQERQKLLEATVFARTSPEQKLNLIDIHQQDGAAVAMIGDGVNDAPALKKADIGVAMGKRGTQVAREAGDMVLQDDRFGTIILAIRLGRAIFGNIRKFITYLLALNMAEILAVGAASLANLPLPILPLQILYLNLITDVFPALALGVGKGEPHIMSRPPRDPHEPILTRTSWLELAGYGMLIAGLSLGALLIARHALGMSDQAAVTVSYLTMGFAQILHVLNVRARGSNWFVNEVTRNRWVWAAIAVSIVLILLTVYVPFLATALTVQTPATNGWLVIAGMSILTYILGQIPKSLSGQKTKQA